MIINKLNTSFVIRHSSFVILKKLVRHWLYPGSAHYWERRYARGGHSGSGSQGVVAAFKADFLNRFVAENRIATIVELGCGDGQQLQLAQYPKYTGLDIAPSAIARCRELFAGDDSKQFAVYDLAVFDPAAYRGELALSLEVIFHLTEDVVYQTYLSHLFALAEQWVIVFNPNIEDITGGIYPHFRLREWLPDVPAGWELMSQTVCPHQVIAPASFWIFKRK